MKIDRLIGIITILLQNDKITAPELAERFEVSRRTINRDIEDICMAGIPIVTTQGVNGGISIMDGYKIEKTLFSEEELRSIFAGLSSLSSVSKDKKYQNIIDKFAANKDALCLPNHIMIDLSSHYKDTLAPKIDLLQNAIQENVEVYFRYHNKFGDNTVTVAPYLIVFQWSSWYLLGQNDGQFKLYKLNRMTNLAMTDKTFELQEIPPEKLDFNRYYTEEIHAVILFENSEKYRLLEDYGVGSFTEQEDGKLRFEFPFTNQSFLISWVLGFGENAELLEPVELRKVICEQLAGAAKKYLQ